MEKREPEQSMKPKIEGRDPREVFQHVHLLQQAGFVEVFFTAGYNVDVNHLTCDGHDFLDAIRDSTVWAKVTKKLKEVGGTASLSTVKALATADLKEQLGLDG